MDYEKKYKEALEKARQFSEHPLQEDSANIVEYIFPELKESENERIRKALIDLVKCNERSGYTLLNNVTTDSMLAWLEKQGEKESVTCPICGWEIKKQGEQKPAENKGMNLVEEGMTPFQKKVFCIIDTTIEEEQGLKQVCDELLRLAHDEIIHNPAWSEEDDAIRNDLINYFQGSALETSEKEVINWLKSLRPQNTWKPSDEQIEALESATENCAYSEYQDCLHELIMQLKKLREEDV